MTEYQLYCVENVNVANSMQFLNEAQQIAESIFFLEIITELGAIIRKQVTEMWVMVYITMLWKQHIPEAPTLIYTLSVAY